MGDSHQKMFFSMRDWVETIVDCLIDYLVLMLGNLTYFRESNMRQDLSRTVFSLGV